MNASKAVFDGSRLLVLAIILQAQEYFLGEATDHVGKLRRVYYQASADAFFRSGWYVHLRESLEMVYGRLPEMPEGVKEILDGDVGEGV